ncbi:hypothetical protein EAF04_009064 [Stromatinia cepivora]|nr:hypothetical protein EAF04_009064 [Stromatinia cepivora]
MSIQTHPNQYATPPGSFTSPPLTPPPTTEKTSSLVSRIIEEIRNRQEGRNVTSEPWIDYSLDPKGYKELQQELQRDESLWGFTQHKLRYDYFPSISRLVLRMPTTLHEAVIIKVMVAIQAQLDSIQSASADFARDILSEGSGSIKFPDGGFDRHDPDAQFRHPRARFPGVVIEVSYSQKRKDLGRLADDYIIGSNGNIKVVVGLDVEYKNTKKATLSVWRWGTKTNEAGKNVLVSKLVVANQVFRDTNGNPSGSPTGGLRLRLRDFVPTGLAGAELQLRDPIIIPSNKLYSWLEQAEGGAPFAGQEIGFVQADPPWEGQERRDSSPVEELSQRDEERFRVDESRVEGLAIRDDSSYKAGSTSEEEAG